MEQEKPRVRFCWDCGAKLYGNQFKVINVDGYEKIVHGTCGRPDRECADNDCPYDDDLYVDGYRP